VLHGVSLMENKDGVQNQLKRRDGVLTYSEQVMGTAVGCDL
jgi:hypothetical protein